MNSRYITGEVKNAFYKYDIETITLLKGARMIEISRRDVLSRDFEKTFRKKWVGIK